jgi:CheY-like chemotaxis protein
MTPKQILFVDDEPEYVRPQVDALSDAGYEVILITDSDEAITFLEDRKPDLIILDLIMPPRQQDVIEDEHEIDLVETGMKLYKDIREDLGLTDIPIIFLSVVRDREIRREISEKERKYNQRHRFLAKPISSSEVVTEVQVALGDLNDVFDHQ